MSIKYKKITFPLLIFMFLISNLCSYVSADSDYSIGVEAGTKIIWQYSEVNQELISKLINNESYSSSYTEITEDYQIRWDIEDVYSYTGIDTDYWNIEYTLYVGEDLSEDPGEYDYRWVAEDPKVLADDWFVDEAYLYSLVIIPINSKDYLKEFDENIPTINKSVYYVDGSKFIEDFTQEGDHDKIVIEYNEEGIQEEYSVYYDGDLAMRYELIGIESSFDDVLIYVIIGIVIAIIVIGVLIGLAVYNKNKSPKVKSFPSPQTPAQQSSMSLLSKPSQQAPDNSFAQRAPAKKIGFCSLCGYEREDDAVYCPGCGQKFKD